MKYLSCLKDYFAEKSCICPFHTQLHIYKIFYTPKYYESIHLIAKTVRFMGLSDEYLKVYHAISNGQIKIPCPDTLVKCNFFIRIS